MSTLELLAELDALEVRLALSGEELVVRGKKQALTPALIERLRRDKALIVDSLRSRGAVPEAAVPAELSVELSAEQRAAIEEGVPGGASNIQDIYPLAPLQEGIFFHHLLSPVGDPYLLISQFAFDSQERLHDFVAALQAVVNRHDILRTGLAWEGLNEPLQVVWRQAPLQLEELTLPVDCDAARELRERFDPRRHRIDLRQAPLMRLQTAQDGASGRWVLQLLWHHLVGDHTTLDVMREEMQALLLGEHQQLPQPTPYRDVVTQARLGVPRAEHEAFFKKMLGDIDEPTAPFGLLDVQQNGRKISEAQRDLDAALSASVREQSRRFGVSAASIFHLAWSLVLARLTGRSQVVFGTVLFGRMQGRQGTRRGIGLFINTLPIRQDIAAVSVEQGLRQTQTTLAQLLRHEHASLALAQRESGVPAPTPLFTTLLNYRHSAEAVREPSPTASDSWSGIEGIFTEERTNYPLTLSVDDFGEDFGLTVQVDATLEPERVGALMQRALERLVGALLRTPQAALDTLDILPDAERHWLLQACNDTAHAYAHGLRAHELFESQVTRAPEATAVLHEGQRLSYAELNQRANRLAHRLRAQGVGRETRVAIALERGLALPVAVLAVWKAGGAYVPLDPAYPRERLRHMLADSSPLVVLTEPRLQSGTWAELLDGHLVLDATQDCADQPDHDLDGGVGCSPDDLAYVIYTSGSSGRAKGVLVEHRGVVNLAAAQAQRLSIERDSVVLQAASLSFDACLWELVMALCQGAALVLPAAGEVVAGDVLARLLARYQVTHATLTPAVLAALDEPSCLAGLQLLVVAGDVLSGALLQRLAQGQRIVNAYGPTESTVCATMHECLPDVAGAPPIGRPIANMRVHVLGPDGALCPTGVVGELYIAGIGVARGYLNRPELSAERFVHDAFSTEAHARMYRTGDLGRRLRDGSIEFLGRNDHQVKVRGFRIELGEIEARLLELPAITEAVVLARDDGAAGKRLVAYVVADGEWSRDDLKAHLAATLPEHMLPSAVVQLERFPLTPNGKLDRRALPAPEASAAPVFEAPSGELETAVARIWAELLGVERVGRRDHFFELGGHSLLTVQVCSRLRQTLAVDVPISELFARPILSEFVAAMATAARAALPPVRPERRPEHVPASFAQQRLWFLAQLDDQAQAYLIPLGLRLRGALNPGALAQALDDILARHEALRTTFQLVNGQLAQRVAAVGESRFQLRECAISDPNELLKRAEQEAVEPFDLERGPLLRGLLIRESAECHTLLLTMHHIVSDGWSTGVLARELSLLYAGYAKGTRVALPELGIQYADWALWQRRWVSGEILEKQAEFWQTALLDAPTLLELPTDRPRGTEQDYAGSSTPLQLSPELSVGLKELSRRHGTTLFMTLLAAWAALLARLSGQSEVVVGTPSANRGRRELEDLIGFFVNTLALRISPAGASVSELLAQVKARTLAAQDHQDIPFEQVVERVNPPRSLAHSPLFQVMFAWQDGGGGRGASLELPELDVELADDPTLTHAKFDLTLTLHESGGRIEGALEYKTALFDRETILRFLEYYARLLEGMVTDSRSAVERLPILPEAEQELLLRSFNRTFRQVPARALHELFELQAARDPHALAVLEGQRTLSYAELDAWSSRLAAELVALGVKPGEYVALALSRSIELVVAELAVCKAGAVYVPLDVALPVERKSLLFVDCGARVLLTTSQTLEPSLGEERRLCVDALLPHTGLAFESVRTSADAAAYVMYTSGSTGTPKGVVVAHRGVVRLVLDNGYAAFDATDRVAFAANPAFDAATLEVWAPLLTGGTIVVIDKETFVEPARLAAELEAQRVSALFVTTAIFNQCASATPRAFAGLRYLMTGGERCDPGAFATVLAHGAPRHLIHCYGPTETTTFATSYEVTQVPSGADTLPIGRPIGNTSVYILDQALQPVPLGVTGELYIGGPGVALGYLNRPELTAARFIADPFSEASGARLYKTGDLGRYRSDGAIEFVGRNDFQVKIRGFRIEPGEIEARLLEHPALSEVVVVAREDSPGVKRLVAYFTAGSPVSAEELRRHLSASLPDYMLPSAFVPLVRMPLSPSGKIERKALPAPAEDAYAVRGYAAPETEVEHQLARLWSKLLGVTKVGRLDNFFELGGHSLLAVSLIEAMRDEGMHADVRAIFGSANLAELALAVTGNAGQVQVPQNLIPDACQQITPEMVTLVDLTAEELERALASVSGGAGNVQDIYPLAPLQEGILFHHLLNLAGDPYLLLHQLVFDSRQRLDAFVAALAQVIARHDMLRTSLAWEGLPEPVQVVHRAVELPVEEVDVGPSADAAAVLRERFDPRTYRIDLQRAPLLRLQIALDPRQHVWVLQIVWHHLIGDHTALGVMQSEITEIMQGRGHDLPPAPRFRNVVAQAKLANANGEHAAFFERTLGDVTEPTAPFDLLNVHRDGSSVNEARSQVELGLAMRLRERAKRLGVSAASLFHEAFALVLSRVTGRDDVVFGTVLLGRMQGGAGAGQGIGLFMNTLPIRLQVNADSVEASTLRAHARLAELLRHEHAPLALAVRASGVVAPTPLFSALLNYRHSAPQSATGDDEASGIQGVFAEERTNYPLTLSIDDWGDEFGITVQVDSSVDAERVVGFMQCALEQLVRALESAPETPVRELDVLPAPERTQVVESWNATEESLPLDCCLPQLFEAQVARTPRSTALVVEGERLSYSELNRRANRLAHQLRALGVGPEARVAICVERSVEMVVGLLAILKAGGAYVPLDPSYPSERLRYMLEDARPTVLLLQPGLLSELAHSAVAIPRLELRGAFEGFPEHDLDAKQLGLTPHSLAYIIYTSGSTGAPKGAMNEHRGIVNRLSWMQREYGLLQDDAVLQKTPFSFDVSVWELFWPLLSGARLVMARPEGHKDPAYLADVCERERITTLHFVPSMLQVFLEHDSARRCHGVRRVICSGEALPVAAVERFFEVLPRVELHNLYGPTEAAVDVTAFRCAAGGAQSSVPIGRPIANTQIYILDSRGRPSPIGVAGELYIGGIQVGRGYFERPELTEQRFVASPFGSGKLYKTGDLARWLPGGTIEYLGRNDFQVKIRGFRVELGEIEASLLQHAAVREAAVLARVDVPGDPRLVAYVVAGPELDLDELRAHLAERLPSYMVPAAFVSLPAMPLSPNGKLERKALPRPELAGVGADDEPAQDELEQQIADVWQNLLGVDRIGRSQTFFELGGHSLLTMRAVSRLSERGIRLDVADMYAYPSVLALAARVRSKGQEPSSDRATAIRNHGEGTPLFFVHDGRGQLLYAHQLGLQLEQGFPVYGLPVSQELLAEPCTMHSLARRLLPLIRQVQPRGPYRLAGWSFGGSLAYEIAAQLLGEDEQVEFLALLDSHYLAALNMPAPESVDEQLIVQSLLAAGVPGDAAQIRRSIQIERRLAQANFEYRALPLPVPVRLFVAREQDGDARRGWGFSRADVRVIEVDGDHDSMLQAPRLADLARVFSRALAEPERAPAASGSYAPSIVLQTGRSELAPLYCVPGAGASVVSFSELVSALGRERSVFGLQPRGLDAARLPHTSVEAAAECYAKVVLDARPRSAVHLVGHSFGGWIAFELAVRLRKSGLEVASLTLLDSESPGEQTRSAALNSELDVLEKWLEICEMIADAPLGLSRAELGPLSDSQRLARVHARLGEVGLVPKRSRPEVLWAPLVAFAAALRTSYAPSASYPGAVGIAIMHDPKLDAAGNLAARERMLQGWGRLTASLSPYLPPGNHMSALRAPNVFELAAWLNSRLLGQR